MKRQRTNLSTKVQPFPTDEIVRTISGQVFQLIKPIGEGSYGIVYRAKGKTDGTLAAVKVFKQGKRFEGAFLREYEVFREINIENPYIVKSIEYVLHKGYHCMVQELLSENIRDICLKICDKEPLSLWCIQKFAKDVLHGLMVLHAAGFVHADLKHGNIMWSVRSECFKLFDFGLSFHSSETLGHAVQSVGFRAPEASHWNTWIKELSCKKMRNKPEALTAAIDIWSLGCMLLEAVTMRDLLMNGRQPCNFKHEDKNDCPSVSCISEKFENQAEVVEFDTDPDIFDLLKDLVVRCLEHDHKKRITVMEAARHGFLQLKFMPDINDLFLPTRTLCFLEVVTSEDLNNKAKHRESVEKFRNKCAKYGDVQDCRVITEGSDTELGAVVVMFANYIQCAAAKRELANWQYNEECCMIYYYPTSLVENGKK